MILLHCRICDPLSTLNYCGRRKKPVRLPKVAVRWLERFIEECEPTLGEVGLVVAALAGLTDEHRVEAVRVLRGLDGSF